MQDLPITLPPIRTHAHFGQNQQSEYRPAPNFGSVSSSISEILAETQKHPEQRSENDSITSAICIDCQKVLLHAFEHCLTKQGDIVPLPSTHEVDEESDAKILTNAPLFDIVKDPTRFNPRKVFEDPQEIIDREKWVHKQAKKVVALSVPKVKGLGIKPRKSFSGAIYKRMLDAKEREITALRTQLYESSKMKEFETENVRRLKQALHQSVNYYTFAEEWQQSEASRLQKDIRQLKAEASSLIAILINAEIEKQGLLQEMKGLRDEILAEKHYAAKCLQQADDMKEKLRLSYLEYIEANKTMVQLRKEAEKGTDAVEQRNSMLQKNLSKLSFDYESSAKDLKAATGRCRELEFEVAQLTKELNIKGEALVKTASSEEMLKDNLDKTNTELQKLQKSHEQLLAAKSKVELDSRTIIAKHTRQIRELKSDLEKTTGELALMSEKNSGLETLSKTQAEEIEDLKKSHGELRAEKELMDVKYRKSEEYATTEISNLNVIIEDLTTTVSRNDVQIKDLTERSESLASEVASLTSALATEKRNVDDLNAENHLLRRTTETQAFRLNQQIEKLTHDKSFIATENKQHVDKLLLLRRELAEKKEELELTIKKWKGIFTDKSEELQKKSSDYDTLNFEHKTLQDKFNALGCSYEATLEKNRQIKDESDIKTKKLSEIDDELAKCHIKITELAKEIENDREVISDLNRRNEDLLKRMRNQNSEKEATMKSHELYKKEINGKIQARDEEIAKLNQIIANLDQKIIELLAKIQDMETIQASTKLKLAETESALVDEIGIRDLLQTQLNSLRSSYQDEHRVRSELEKIQLKSKFRGELRNNSALDARDKKLREISLALEGESNRLSKLVNIMPLLESNEEEAFQIPADLLSKKKK